MFKKNRAQYHEDIERYTKEITTGGLSPMHIFDVIARSKDHAVAALSNNDALNIRYDGIPLAHHIPYCWESIGILMIYNPKLTPLFDIVSDNGDTTLHTIIRNSSRSRRTLLERGRRDCLKIANTKNGVSISHLLAFDDRAICKIINSNEYRKELLRRENFSGSSVAHWVAQHSLTGSKMILNKLECGSTETENFFKYVLRQKDKNNNTVMNLIRERWINMLILQNVFHQ